MAAVLLAVGMLVLGDCLDAGSALRAIRWDIALLLPIAANLAPGLQLPPPCC